MGDVAKISDLDNVFENVIGKLLGFAAIALFIMLLAGGFRYITSGEDPKATEAAKKTLTSAIGGIVLIAISYLIILIIQEITGANITEFTIFGE